MKFNNWGIFVLLSTIFLFSCASYKVQTVKVEPVKSYKNKVNISDIVIAVDPFDETEKSKSVFYADLTGKNIKPLHVIVRNDSEYDVFIIRSEILLTYRNGDNYQHVNSNYVFNRFEHNELLYLFFGGFLSFKSADDANEKMQADWFEKEFPEEKVISSQRKASGFVFFETPQHLSGGTVVIPVMNYSTDKIVKFEIPIS